MKITKCTAFNAVVLQLFESVRVVSHIPIISHSSRSTNHWFHVVLLTVLFTNVIMVNR